MAKKASKVEAREREERIYAMQLDGHSKFAIVRYAAAEWGIKQRQVENYITAINERLEKQMPEKMEILRQKAIDRCERFRRKCAKHNDRQYESSMIREINEIEGVKIKRVEHSGDLSITALLADLDED